MIRIGERIAQLVLELPRKLDTTRVREAALLELRTAYLSKRSALAIADAITALSRAIGEMEAAGSPPPPAEPTRDDPTSEDRSNE